MFLINRIASLCLMVVATMLLVLCGGCGSSSANSSNNSMSSAQAQAVTDQVVQALTQALASTFPSNLPAANDVHPNLSTVVRNIGPNVSSGCTSTATGENCNWPISLPYYPCVSPGGGQEGSISVTGDIDGTLNNSGSGSVSADITITPTNCSVSNLIINGDPSISIASQINLTGTALSFPIIFTETGGISYGPNPSGSCQINATYTMNSLSSCTVSGTVCGQSVSGSC